jgi:hypothetical protein
MPVPPKPRETQERRVPQKHPGHKKNASQNEDEAPGGEEKRGKPESTDKSVCATTATEKSNPSFSLITPRSLSRVIYSDRESQVIPWRCVTGGTGYLLTIDAATGER